VVAEVYEIHPPQGKRNQTFTGDKLDWIFAGTRRLKPSVHQVGVFIVQHINGRLDRQRWSPSEEYIAEALGMSRPTVERAVRALTKNRWLTVERKRDYDYRTGAWKTHNVYSKADMATVLNDEIQKVRREWRRFALLLNF
jgi:DNA-binding transcriptional ArsR family regulator